MTLLKMSSSPHNRGENTTRELMGKVLIALSPSLVWACFIFGLRSLVLSVIAVASAVGFEALYCLLMKKPQSAGDLSAAVTGLLIAFNMPVSAPLWMPAAGSFFAIIIVKMIFGGIGKNIVNPALAARVFMLSSWTSEMSAFTSAEYKISPIKISVDTVSSATALTSLKSGAVPGYSVFDMFIGNIPGCIGEVSSVLLLAGGIYLILSKVITWHIPVAFLGTVALITFFLPRGAEPFNVEYMLYELLSGGLILGAVFMATDYATSPMTKPGKLIYGVGCGLITVFIRYFGGYPEGVSFSILIMNLMVWYLDRFTAPTPFGGKRK